MDGGSKEWVLVKSLLRVAVIAAAVILPVLLALGSLTVGGFVSLMLVLAAVSPLSVAVFSIAPFVLYLRPVSDGDE